MSIANNIETVKTGGCTLKVSLTQNSSSRGVILLLHGWTGSEDSMWLFSHGLLSQYSFLSPRGHVSTDTAGFGWVPLIRSPRDLAQDYVEAAERIHDLLPEWFTFFGIPSSQPIHIIGFSQGAALALSLGLKYPTQFTKIAVLAGFLPEGFERSFSQVDYGGKTFFLSHGIEDEIVNIQKARTAKDFLISRGARVIYCEEPGGHKIGKSCLSGVYNYFNSGSVVNDPGLA